MTVFEPRFSGTGSDRSVNWATTTAHINNIVRLVHFNYSVKYLICTNLGNVTVPTANVVFYWANPGLFICIYYLKLW